jgi:hypothetical protein
MSPLDIPQVFTSRVKTPEESGMHEVLIEVYL